MIIPDTLGTKIKRYIDEGKDLHKIASWLINIEIHKHVPIDLEDLADTSVVADEVAAIVECLEQGDYQDAISISKESAQYILDEEGFDF
jgi:hypothetical protein